MKKVLVIGCLSREENLRKVFRSMVRVFSQYTVAGLKKEWLYSDEGPYDVRIIDLDDELNKSLPDVDPSAVIVISSDPHKLAGYKYPLSKPLRSQSLLHVLQAIESCKLPLAPVGAEKHGEGLDFTGVSLDQAADNVASVDQGADQQVLRLRSWPDITRLPEDIMLNAARVAALLAIRPRSRDSVAKFLEVSASELDGILRIMMQCAHGSNLCLVEEMASPTAEVVEFKNETPVQAKNASFLSKLWSRLKRAA